MTVGRSEQGAGASERASGGENGPAPEPAEVRERILDAASQCLLEFGYQARLHAVIAERAGLSRPTLYKYVGDQPAIMDALFEREVARFFTMFDPVLHGSGALRMRFVDAVVFVVQYGRAHELLQKGLREDPDVVLPWFTTRAGSVVERAVDVLVPHVRRLLGEEELGSRDPRAIAEWAFRIISSLLTTPGVVDTSDESSLRRFVSELLGIAFIPEPGAPVPGTGGAASSRPIPS